MAVWPRPWQRWETMWAHLLPGHHHDGSIAVDSRLKLLLVPLNALELPKQQAQLILCIHIGCKHAQAHSMLQVQHMQAAHKPRRTDPQSLVRMDI